MTPFTRLTEWAPAYNKISEGYGRHGMEVRFVLKGAAGAVQFVLYTNWLTSGDRFEARHGGLHCTDGIRRNDNVSPQPADLGYHALAPQYEGQPQRECGYVDGGKCYYDGSGLNAADAFDVFTDDGEEALWSLLETYYQATFEGGAYPAVIGRRFRADMAAARP
jgi:hypothetical protein